MNELHEVDLDRIEARAIDQLGDEYSDESLEDLRMILNELRSLRREGGLHARRD